ncbi:MAG: hypothetical protein GY804_12590 [Alphaproteobacteria bacterium]|nr:hypothetical protein [Alphaproteobacteria bacterium]
MNTNLTKQQLEALVEEYEGIIQFCYNACMCERFTTYGFDYGETHPRANECTNMKPKSGARKNTPRVRIENSIGVTWRYKTPTRGAH